MSESRDRAMRRSRGTSRNVIDGKVKLERARSAGQHEQVVFPSQEKVKEAVLSGICPCCGAGPFRLLARHTHAQHGIDKKELRDLAGMAYRDSITPPEMRERRRGITLELIAAGRLCPPRGVERRAAVVSKAGKERRKRKPSADAPPCVNCGRAARRKDASNWQEPNRTSGGWLKTCSDECTEARAQTNYESRTRQRPACVVCGADIPVGRGRLGRVEQHQTCSSGCNRARRQKATDELMERVAVAYLREAQDGRPPGFMGRLAAEFDKPEETVRSWVSRARTLGWLGPTSPGKRGAEAGARLKPPAA